MSTEDEEDDDAAVVLRSWTPTPVLQQKITNFTTMEISKDIQKTIEIQGSQKYNPHVTDGYTLSPRARYLYPNLKMILENPEQTILIEADHSDVNKGVLAIHEVKQLWRDSLKRMILMLQLRESFATVKAANISASKKMNAQDNILIPGTKTSVAKIFTESEEKEREEFYRIEKIICGKLMTYGDCKRSRKRKLRLADSRLLDYKEQWKDTIEKTKYEGAYNKTSDDFSCATRLTKEASKLDVTPPFPLLIHSLIQDAIESLFDADLVLTKFTKVTMANRKSEDPKNLKSAAKVTVMKPKTSAAQNITTEKSEESLSVCEELDSLTVSLSEPLSKIFNESHITLGNSLGNLKKVSVVKKVMNGNKLVSKEEKVTTIRTEVRNANIAISGTHCLHRNSRTNNVFNDVERKKHDNATHDRIVCESKRCDCSVETSNADLSCIIRHPTSKNSHTKTIKSDINHPNYKMPPPQVKPCISISLSSKNNIKKGVYDFKAKSFAITKKQNCLYNTAVSSKNVNGPLIALLNNILQLANRIKNKVAPTSTSIQTSTENVAEKSCVANLLERSVSRPKLCQREDIFDQSRSDVTSENIQLELERELEELNERLPLLSPSIDLQSLSGKAFLARSCKVRCETKASSEYLCESKPPSPNTFTITCTKPISKKTKPSSNEETSVLNCIEKNKKDMAIMRKVNPIFFGICGLKSNPPVSVTSYARSCEEVPSTNFKKIQLKTGTPNPFLTMTNENKQELIDRLFYIIPQPTPESSCATTYDYNFKTQTNLNLNPTPNAADKTKSVTSTASNDDKTASSSNVCSCKANEDVPKPANTTKSTNAKSVTSTASKDDKTASSSNYCSCKANEDVPKPANTTKSTNAIWRDARTSTSDLNCMAIKNGITIHTSTKIKSNTSILEIKSTEGNTCISLKSSEYMKLTITKNKDKCTTKIECKESQKKCKIRKSSKDNTQKNDEKTKPSNLNICKKCLMKLSCYKPSKIFEKSNYKCIAENCPYCEALAKVPPKSSNISSASIGSAVCSRTTSMRTSSDASCISGRCTSGCTHAASSNHICPELASPSSAQSKKSKKALSDGAIDLRSREKCDSANKSVKEDPFWEAYRRKLLDDQETTCFKRRNISSNTRDASTSTKNMARYDTRSIADFPISKRASRVSTQTRCNSSTYQCITDIPFPNSTLTCTRCISDNPLARRTCITGSGTYRNICCESGWMLYNKAKSYLRQSLSDNNCCYYNCHP